jgi:hypothetical protein
MLKNIEPVDQFHVGAAWNVDPEIKPATPAALPIGAPLQALGENPISIV